MREKLSLGIGFLFLATFICCFYPGSAGAQKPRVKPVGRVTVVDSKGKTVGTLLGGLGMTFVHAGHNIPFTPTVLLDVEGRLIALDIDRERFFTDTILYYESTNCSGRPWLLDISGERLQGLLPPAAIGSPGHTVYVPAPDSTSRDLSIGSIFTADGGCFSFFNQTRVVPTEALIDLDTEFTPPFHLRAGP